MGSYFRVTQTKWRTCFTEAPIGASWSGLRLFPVVSPRIASVGHGNAANDALLVAEARRTGDYVWQTPPNQSENGNASQPAVGDGGSTKVARTMSVIAFTVCMAIIISRSQRAARLICLWLVLVAFIAPRPAHAAEPPVVAHVAAAGATACALLVDGTIWCWGKNLIEPTQKPDATPVLIRDIPPMIEVSAAEDHFCARTTQDRVWCWGRDGNGIFRRPTAIDDRRHGSRTYVTFNWLPPGTAQLARLPPMVA